VSGILFSFAHPDDETVLAGGLIGKCAASGIPVALSVATRGEAGKVGDPPVCAVEDLPAVREAELRRAAALLGLEDLTLLGYRDRELAGAPVENVRRQLVSLLRTRRPQVVVTFDPNGSNLHPDHVAISRFTADAIAAAADARWFPEDGEPHAVDRFLWTPPQRPWNLMRAPGFPALAGVDFVIDIADWSARKAEALRAHRSQHLSLNRIFFSQPDVGRLLSLELFRQAWGPVLAVRPRDDVFAGL
jgi:LmbE family N-acetylglucosaminyl deacetylase